MRRSPWISASAVCGGRWASSQSWVLSKTVLRWSRCWYLSQIAIASGDSAPGTSAGSIACNPARNSASCATSTVRAAVYSSSRRMRRAMASPGTRRMTRPGVPRWVPSSSSSTSGARNPARVHARITSASRRIVPGWPGRFGGARRRISSSPHAGNDQVSRDAPPVSLRGAVTSTGAPSTGASAVASPSETDGGADGDVIDDLVEVLRQARAVAVVAGPAGHALSEARDHAVATVAQRDARRHLAVQLVRVVVGGDDDVAPAHVPLVVVVGRELHVAHLHHAAVSVAVEVEHPAVDVAQVWIVLVTAHRARQTEATAEAGGDPAVPPDALPDARPPRVVAQSEGVLEVEALAVHLHQPGDRHLLLGVALGEAVRGAGRRFLAVVVDRLATRRLRHRGEAEIDRALLARVRLERSAGVGHLPRVHEHAHVAVVGDVVLLVRRDDVELQAAGVVRDVSLDVRPLEHEPDPPVGEVEAHGHLRVPLVGP